MLEVTIIEFIPNRLFKNRSHENHTINITPIALHCCGFLFFAFERVMKSYKVALIPVTKKPNKKSSIDITPCHKSVGGRQ